MSLCQSCGHSNPAGTKFCGECGTRLARNRAEAISAQLAAIHWSDASLTAGNQIGSFQFDSLKSHSHKYYRDKTTSGDDGSSPQYERHSPYLTDTTNTGGYETRPRNVYVNYIIKL